MSDYDNTNRGVLFQNTRKKHPKAPDWSGTIDIDGAEYQISGWAKTTAKGELISLKRETDDWKSKSPAPNAAPQSNPEEDDGIPF